MRTKWNTQVQNASPAETYKAKQVLCLKNEAQCTPRPLHCILCHCLPNCGISLAINLTLKMPSEEEDYWH